MGEGWAEAGGGKGEAQGWVHVGIWTGGGHPHTSLINPGQRSL
jgi:hypothetical protein